MKKEAPKELPVMKQLTSKVISNMWQHLIVA